VEPLLALVVVAALAIAGGRLATQFWIIRRYRAGRIAPRNARWLILAISAAPYLVLFALMLIIEPGLWWVVLLLFIASWPLIVLPAILAVDGTSKPK
jgi:hypothetical protein